MDSNCTVTPKPKSAKEFFKDLPDHLQPLWQHNYGWLIWILPDQLPLCEMQVE